MRVNNPRFPHTCRITRNTDEGPMSDESVVSNPMLDEDPMADSEPTSGTGGDETQDPAQEEPTQEGEEVKEGDSVIYEGKCRAYDKHTTSDKGEVITSYRALALPLTRDDWQKLGVVPRAGDIIVVDRGGYTEYGFVLDSNPANFGGTHLIWKYGRN